MAKPLEVVCFFDKDCEFKKKDNNNGCMWDGTCNQQAKPYFYDGKLIYLRKSDYVLMLALSQFRETEPKTEGKENED